jgi:glyoxylase-like metal-dependent hydrolase (beta-lactamase superfamily II)
VSDLVVRAYNVGFGDAILVSVPEVEDGGAETVRHLLIDVGNLLVGEGNDDRVFRRVVEDIARRTGGAVDLYVMTHEHLDHVQGLLAASRAGIALTARHAWLTGSAHPDYYETHEEAKKRRLDARLAVEDAVRLQEAAPDPWVELMVRNNSGLLPGGAFGLSTADYVDHLRTLAAPEHTHYVDRETALAGTHPFREARLRILAPEEDTADYYGRSRGGSLTAASSGAGAPASAARPLRTLDAPPAGVNPGAYFDLLAARRQSTRGRIRQIDAANNNTSLVLELEWRGWRLLFAGDAELKSWKKMHEQGGLRPVHFVKVSHHGSHNGTHEELFDELMPPVAPDGRPRHALVCTHVGDWDSVPDDATLAVYSARAQLHDTREVAPGAAVEIAFPG